MSSIVVALGGTATAVAVGYVLPPVVISGFDPINGAQGRLRHTAGSGDHHPADGQTIVAGCEGAPPPENGLRKLLTGRLFGMQVLLDAVPSRTFTFETR